MAEREARDLRLKKIIRDHTDHTGCSNERVLLTPSCDIITRKQRLLDLCVNKLSPAEPNLLMDLFLIHYKWKRKCQNTD